MRSSAPISSSRGSTCTRALSFCQVAPISAPAACMARAQAQAMLSRLAMPTIRPFLPANSVISNAPDQKDCRETGRSEEHTSELQSPCNLVCRLLLEKKKNSETRTSTAAYPLLATTALLIPVAGTTYADHSCTRY